MSLGCKQWATTSTQCMCADVRYASGSNPSKYTYTGQYSHTADFGLMFYNARWYDPSLSRFASADTIVPAGVSSLGNAGHEIIIPWFGYDDGASWQDYALARAGMNIGTLVNMGVVPPSQLGNTIKYYLGPNGPGAFYVNPLKYAAPLDGNS